MRVSARDELNEALFKAIDEIAFGATGDLANAVLDNLGLVVRAAVEAGKMVEDHVMLDRSHPWGAPHGRRAPAWRWND